MTFREQSAHHPIPARASRADASTTSTSRQTSTGHHAGLHPEDAPETTTVSDAAHWEAARREQAHRDASMYLDEEGYEYVPKRDDEEERPARGLVAKSALPYGSYLERKQARERQLPAPTRRPAARPDPRQTEELRAPLRRVHGLVYVGLALLLLLIGYVALTSLFAWVQEQDDTLHYGYPRLAQYDAVVGHSDSASHPSHYLALNLHGQVEVIEFPGGDASHAKVYVGPTLIGPNSDLAVVTLTFADVNGDGKLDMVINVQGSHFVLLNTGTAFRPATPADHVTLPN